MTAISSMCWCCLKAFLKLDAARKEFANLELTTDPLLHELIDFHLPHLQESREMKDFLMIWLDRNNSVVNNPCFNRKIFGQLFRETLQKIASHLKCDLKEEDKILYEKVS